jgi:hypothetical protein
MRQDPETKHCIWGGGAKQKDEKKMGISRKKINNYKGNLNECVTKI